MRKNDLNDLTSPHHIRSLERDYDIDKSNKKACRHLANRSTQVIQDIWREAKEMDLNILSEQVKDSIIRVEKYVFISFAHIYFLFTCCFLL